MRSFIALPLLWAFLTAGFWYATVTTLTDMTRRACHLGSVKACQQLIDDGVKL